MRAPPVKILREGRKILDPVMNEYGFSFEEGAAGPSCGGDYASGSYVNGNRKLEIHYRYSLGMVTYHFGETCIDHESYMRAVLGNGGGNRYPGFSDEPLDAFKDLAHDLRKFATAFMKGNFK